MSTQQNNSRGSTQPWALGPMNLARHDFTLVAQALNLTRRRLVTLITFIALIFFFLMYGLRMERFLSN